MVLTCGYAIIVPKEETNMKKALLPILLTVALLLAGCANAKAPAGESTAPGTENSGQATEPDSEIQNSDSSSATRKVVYERETFERTDAVPKSAQAVTVHYAFRTVRDLETYLFTGSENLADYSQPPTPDFPFPTLTDRDHNEFTLADEFKKGYCSLETAFGIDADQISTFREACFFRMDNGNGYRFTFENVTVNLTYAPGYCLDRTVRDFFEDFYVGKVNLQTYTDFSALSDGFTIRNAGNTNVIYETRNGITMSVMLIAENDLIGIGCGSSDNKTQAETLQQQFLTSPEFAPFAELFSPDDAVFQARVNSVIQNISNRYQD